MENIVSTALNYLNKDYLINASIIEPIKTGSADILFASDDCVMVKDKLSEVFMLQTENFDLADGLLARVHSEAALVAHNPELAKFCMQRLGFESSTPCFQGVYRKGFLVEQPSDLHIRLMTEDEAEEACGMYHFNLESAVKHIRLGLVYGGYVDGKTAAMIGMHLQGSMGLLEVKPQYRRNGYAEVLEKFLINSLLKKSLVPYCQIVEGNEPSLALQRKLGVEISKNQLFWLHKK